MSGQNVSSVWRTPFTKVSSLPFSGRIVRRTRWLCLTADRLHRKVAAQAMKGTGPWRERCREPRYAEKRNRERQTIRPRSFTPNAPPVASVGGDGKWNRRFRGSRYRATPSCECAMHRGGKGRSIRMAKWGGTTSTTPLVPIEQGSAVFLLPPARGAGVTFRPVEKPREVTDMSTQYNGQRPKAGGRFQPWRGFVALAPGFNLGSSQDAKRSIKR